MFVTFFSSCLRMHSYTNIISCTFSYINCIIEGSSSTIIFFSTVQVWSISLRKFDQVWSISLKKKIILTFPGFSKIFLLLELSAGLLSASSRPNRTWAQTRRVLPPTVVGGPAKPGPSPPWSLRNASGLLSPSSSFYALPPPDLHGAGKGVPLTKISTWDIGLGCYNLGFKGAPLINSVLYPWLSITWIYIYYISLWKVLLVFVPLRKLLHNWYINSPLTWRWLVDTLGMRRRSGSHQFKRYLNVLRCKYRPVTMRIWLQLINSLLWVESPNQRYRDPERWWTSCLRYGTLKVEWLEESWDRRNSK